MEEVTCLAYVHDDEKQKPVGKARKVNMAQIQALKVSSSVCVEGNYFTIKSLAYNFDDNRLEILI